MGAVSLPFPDYFVIDNTTFDIPQNNLSPVATFKAQSLGNEGVVRFDASASLIQMSQLI